MKSAKLKAISVAVVAAAGISMIPATADACSRILMDTDHGQSVVRTLDWSQKLGTVAKVHPVGELRQSLAAPEYRKVAAWKVKHQTVVLEEHDVFHGTAAEAINDKGLSASMLYMAPSAEFLEDHQDKGVPTVHLVDAVAYFAENFANVQEAKEALESGKVQLGWNADLNGAGKHGLHISVQDKSGDVILIQLNDGGKVVIHHGQDDLKVMANAPLQQDHRDYVAQYDFGKLETAGQLNTSISSRDRNARLLWTTQNQKSWNGLNWAQTEGKLQSTFDAAALVPQEVTDADSGETYATWIQYVYNYENGSVKLRNLETYSDIRFNMEDIAKFDKPMCADLATQASEGKGQAQWSECEIN